LKQPDETESRGSIFGFIIEEFTLEMALKI